MTTRLISALSALSIAADRVLDYATLDEVLDEVERGQRHPDHVFGIRLADLVALRKASRKAERV